MANRLRSGGCHCGAVRYQAEVPEPLAGGRCNCSICAIKGVVMVRIAQTALEIVQGADELSCYQFNTMVARHWFCRNCGVHVYHQPRSAPELYGINAATLDGVCPYADFPDVAVNDGVHHMKDHGGVIREAGRLRFEPASAG